MLWKEQNLLPLLGAEPWLFSRPARSVPLGYEAGMALLMPPKYLTLYESADIVNSCQPETDTKWTRSCSLDFPMNLRQNNSPRKTLFPQRTDTTNHARINPSECNLNIERHAIFIWSSTAFSEFIYYYGHTFNFIRCCTSLYTYFFPVIFVTRVPSTLFLEQTLWPSGFFIQYKNFHSLIFYDVLALLERKKFVSLSRSSAWSVEDIKYVSLLFAWTR